MYIAQQNAEGNSKAQVIRLITHIATNTSMIVKCAFVTYVMMTADVGLPDAV